MCALLMNCVMVLYLAHTHSYTNNSVCSSSSLLFICIFVSCKTWMFITP